nr:alginate lyase family protein [uncultured Flavobacterium sp.]
MIYLAFLLQGLTANAQPFVHPGIYHSQEDLERMKKAVMQKQEPIYSGYKIFTENPCSGSSYKMQGPLAMVGRNPTIGQEIYDSDANAAHQNAIMWVITGEKAYAKKAIEILNSWSSALKSITGRDAVLMAGLGPFKMINAAEIIRYTNAGWKDEEIKQAEKNFKEVIYPVIKDFAPFANGNWDAAAMKTVMAVGVFCNDRQIFERALHYYVNGAGNGCVTNYVINEAGQIQESGRDQAHTQLGIGMLAECSEIAWHQGLNLYGYANNRLLKGFEYVAKFNLGNEVPFVETMDRTGKYHHLSIARKDRGPLRAVYEQVYNHYVKRMGLRAPYITAAAEKIRPEGPGKPGADHPGYGTLFFGRPEANLKLSIPAPAAPGALIAEGSLNSISLSWIESVDAKSYTVKRSEKKGGPYTIIAKSITVPGYTDRKVKSGKLYYYTVSASNKEGKSADGVEVGICAGLPLKWQQRSIGQIGKEADCQFDGKRFILSAYGKGLDSLTDELYFVSQLLNKNGEITVRYVPQLSSQFTSFGVTIREGFAANAAHVSLTINIGKTEQIEAPNWHVEFLKRARQSEVVKCLNTISNLPKTVVTNGRLTSHYWMSLKCKDKKVEAFVSLNGIEWESVGSSDFTSNQPLYIGLIAASGMPNSTVVELDEVVITDN